MKIQVGFVESQIGEGVCRGLLSGRQEPVCGEERRLSRQVWAGQRRFFQFFGSVTLWTRIRGSVPLILAPDPALFVLDLQDANTNLFFFKVFLLIPF
jgi:hypothetical protein